MTILTNGNTGLIHVYVAAVNTTSDIDIPNVKLPLTDLDTERDRKLRVFAANYSFHHLDLAVPGESQLR